MQKYAKDTLRLQTSHSVHDQPIYKHKKNTETKLPTKQAVQIDLGGNKQ